jgi:hypothetical protein
VVAEFLSFVTEVFVAPQIYWVAALIPAGVEVLVLVTVAAVVAEVAVVVALVFVAVCVNGGDGGQQAFVMQV